MNRIGLALAMTWCAQAAAQKSGAAFDIKGNYYGACACKVSCPCASAMKPSEPHCDAFMAFHIDKGKVGKTKLDGINMVGVMRSPKDAVVKEAFAKKEVDLL